MKLPNRVPVGGSRIDRSKPVHFTFDGRTFEGCAGDTLASALLANGVALMGRSFKYHRPRGCLTCGSEEPNAIVELRSGAHREPNTRATMAEIFDGLEATSQNRWPSLKYDLLSVNQMFSPFLAAGFYYKTFMWPKGFWEPVYEKFIRRSAGLGSASAEADPDAYEHAHAHCDVLVAGGGPAGMAAALSAGRSGARVVVVEEQPVFGGSLSPEHDRIDGKGAAAWVAEAETELDALENVTLMKRTCLFGYYDHNVLAALERVNDHLAQPPEGQPRQRLWTIRARQVVLACGSHERALSFDDNDRPGVMISSAVRKFVEWYGVTPGRRVVIVTNNDDAYRTAMVLDAAGVNVVCVSDSRTVIGPAAQAAIDAGIRVETGLMPAKALGRIAVRGVALQRPEGSHFEDIECDCIAMSGGWSPDVGLASQTGARPVWREDILGFVPGAPVRAERSAGAGNGAFDLADCLAEGHAAGLEAVKAAGLKSGRARAVPQCEPKEALPPMPVWRAPGKGKAFVDFQNDVTTMDIHLAHQEGFVSVEHTKRYTTLGMATDQGKTSSVNGIAALAIARGTEIAQVGTTRFRPPYSPVAIAAFAGRERGKAYQPLRRTALHECGVKLGAVFVEAGQWVRPQYYPRPDEGVMETIYRESKQVRETAGICDVSTLGKIEIFGPDAGKFLDRLYVNGFSQLAPGKARYGVMLREDGYVFDDGTTSRLDDNHYFMTTTTANAARVLAHMEHASQVLWPELDVHFCSATEQWCGVAVAGPNARTILQQAFGDALDISDASLPFMGVRTFDWRGITARIFRISFSGELAYEVNVPWCYGEAMWNAIWEAGKLHGLIPYGTEALNVLRIEKGHVAGNELDGRTTAADLGLGRMMSAKKNFIGKCLAGREALVAEDRASLVGLKLAAGEGRMRAGAHLVADKENANSETSLGWVTSVADSPQSGCWIALAFLKGGLARNEGKTLFAVSPLYKEFPAVEVVSPHFFDPEGERLHG